MKIERAWKNAATNTLEQWKEIDEDRASRDLANAHGDNALEKLKEKKKLETRFAEYRVTE